MDLGDAAPNRHAHQSQVRPRLTIRAAVEVRDDLDSWWEPEVVAAGGSPVSGRGNGIATWRSRAWRVWPAQQKSPGRAKSGWYRGAPLRP